MGEEPKPADKAARPGAEGEGDQKKLTESSEKKTGQDKNMIEIDIMDEEPPAPIVVVRKPGG